MPPPKAKAQYPPKPPFSLATFTGFDAGVKRSAEGATTGSVLGTPPAPAAELYVTYEEQFRNYTMWEMQDATPFWDENAGDQLGVEPEAGTLANKDRIAQFETADHARKLVKLPGGRKVTFVLGSITYQDGNLIRLRELVPATDGGAPQPRATRRNVWVPLQHPAGAKGWKAPKPVTRSNQWGIKGSMRLWVPTPATEKAGTAAEGRDASSAPAAPCYTEYKYRMVTVWERWDQYQRDANYKILMGPDNKPIPLKTPHWSQGMMTARPGEYAGFVKPMPSKGTDFPSIWVIWEWDAATQDWIENVPSAKNPKYRVDGVFIHRGHSPDWFTGCMSPGPADKETEWGFENNDICLREMWDLLGHVGVSKGNFGKKGSAKWFRISIKDPFNVATWIYK